MQADLGGLQDPLVDLLVKVVDVAVGALLQPVQQLLLDAGLQLGSRQRLGLPPGIPLLRPASDKSQWRPQSCLTTKPGAPLFRKDCPEWPCTEIDAVVLVSSCRPCSQLRSLPFVKSGPLHRCQVMMLLVGSMGRKGDLAGSVTSLGRGLRARRRMRTRYWVIFVSRCLFLCTRKLGQNARCSSICSSASMYLFFNLQGTAQQGHLDSRGLRGLPCHNRMGPVCIGPPRLS